MGARGYAERARAFDLVVDNSRLFNKPSADRGGRPDPAAPFGWSESGMGGPRRLALCSAARQPDTSPSKLIRSFSLALQTSSVVDLMDSLITKLLLELFVSASNASRVLRGHHASSVSNNVRSPGARWLRIGGPVGQRCGGTRLHEKRALDVEVFFVTCAPPLMSHKRPASGRQCKLILSDSGAEAIWPRPDGPATDMKPRDTASCDG